jgi:predicted HAD superfamily Cof-like phosphohydrolase
MSELQEKVATFHVALGQVDPETPRALMFEERLLRARLIAEEAAETVAALVGRSLSYELFAEMVDKVEEKQPDRNCFEWGGLAEIADGCIDLQVVTAGTLLVAGIYDDPLIDEVMRANMAKVGGGKDENGKFRKPPGWTPPDIAGVLKRQGYEP